MEAAYIYLIQDGRHIGTNIYKIGKTVQKDKDGRQISRLTGYSPGTIQLSLWNVHVDSVHDIEKHIIREFRTKYILSHGFEWFMGDWQDMQEDIYTICKGYQRVNPVVKSQTKPNGGSPKAVAKQQKQNDVETINQQVTMYTCQRCAYTTNLKSNMKKHFVRQTPCPPLNSDESCEMLLHSAK